MRLLSLLARLLGFGDSPPNRSREETPLYLTRLEDRQVLSAGAVNLAIMADVADQPEGNMGTTDFTFKVTRTGETHAKTTVEYVVGGVTDGGADPADADDFPGNAFQSGQVIFNADETEQTITIKIKADTDVEADERFRVTLTEATDTGKNPAHTINITTGTADGWIRNDDGPAANSAPEGTDNTVTTLEDTPYIFTTDDFGFSDPNDTPADNFQAVQITTLPGAGTLTNNGIAVTEGDFVSVADITANLLVFTPVANANGTPYTSFTFQVQDDGGMDNGGVDLDQSANTMTINVRPDHDCPTVTLDVEDIDENQFATLTGSFTNPDLPDAHTVVVDWDDPNNATDSTFELVATSDLTLGQTFSSSTDGAVLTVTALDLTTGTVGFSVQHQYLDDGLAPGNGSSSDPSTINVTVTSHPPASTPATPGVVSYGLDFVFSGHADFSQPPPWLTATFESVSSTTVRLTLDATNLTGDQFVSNWYFNLDPSLDPTLLSFDTAGASKTGSFDTPTILGDEDNFKADGDGDFDVEFDFTTGGGADNRFGAGEKYVILISSTQTLTADSFKFESVNGPAGKTGFGSAAHVQGGGIVAWIANGEDSDDDTCQGTASVELVVRNVEPGVLLSAVADINENGTATLTGEFTEPGRLDAHTLVVDWDDPNDAADSTFALGAINSLNVNDTFNSSTDGAVLTITGVDLVAGKVSFSVEHQYLDDGAAPGNATSSDTSTIRVTVTDDDTGEGMDTETLLVKNLAPSVLLSAVADINENGTATLTGEFTEPGRLDAHTLVVDWDDPNDAADSTFALGAINSLNVNDTFNSSTDGAVLTITGVDLVAGKVSFSVEHQYADGPCEETAANTIKVTVTDDDTGQSMDTETVLVKNVDPTVLLSAVADIDENGTATLTGEFTDPGLLDAHTLVVDWGDPNNAANSTFALGATNSLSVNDTFNSSTDGAVLTVTAVDLTTGKVSFSVQHQYLDDGPSTPPPSNNTASDTSTIQVTVIETASIPIDGEERHVCQGTNTVTVLVKNVPPGLTVVGNQNVSKGSLLSLPEVGTFSDVGTLDTHPDVKIDWGDGSQIEDGAVTTGAGFSTISGDHIYFSSGTFTVTVTVTDDDGQSAIRTFEVVVPAPPDDIDPPDPPGPPDLTGLGLPPTSINFTTSGAQGGVIPRRISDETFNTTAVFRETSFARKFDEEIRAAVYDLLTDEEDAVILEVLSPDDQVVDRIRLSLDVLPNLRALWQRLPDGRYKLWLRRDGREFPIFRDVLVVRGGRLVDANRLEETQDRPPGSKVPAKDQPAMKELSLEDVERLWRQLAAPQDVADIPNAQVPPAVSDPQLGPNGPGRPLDATHPVDNRPPGGEVEDGAAAGPREVPAPGPLAGAAALAAGLSAAKGQDPRQRRANVGANVGANVIEPGVPEPADEKHRGLLARLFGRLKKWFGKT